MRADNDGEGGILALSALATRQGARRARGRRWVLVLIGLFGAALLYGDGMITPAISVLGAVEGTTVAAPGLEPFVVPVAVVILIGCSSSSAGHGRDRPRVRPDHGRLVRHDRRARRDADRSGARRCSRAVDPATRCRSSPTTASRLPRARRGVPRRHRRRGALRRHGPLRPPADPLGWFALVLPACCSTTSGRARCCSATPTRDREPLLPLAPRLGALPAGRAGDDGDGDRVAGADLGRVLAHAAGGAARLLPAPPHRHTSATQIGQIYIPAINWLLMVACIGLVLGFRHSANLAAAYGIAVTTTMVITTMLFYVVARERWGWTGGWVVPALRGVPRRRPRVLRRDAVQDPPRRLVPARRRRRRLHASSRRGAPAGCSCTSGCSAAACRSTSSSRAWPSTRPCGRRATSAYLFATPGSRRRRCSPTSATTTRCTSRSCVDLRRHREATAGCRASRRGEIHRPRPGFHQVVLHYGFMEEPDVPRALADRVQ